MLLLALSGQQIDYGLEESDDKEAKNYRKHNEFVINELYPFVKRKPLEGNLISYPFADLVLLH